MKLPIGVLLILRRFTRRLARIRGGKWFTAVVRRAFANREDGVVVHDFDGDLLFECRLGSHISAQIFWDGAYSRNQLRLIDRLLEPDWVYFDIGANEGEQTVFAAKRLPRGRVVAFEPSTPIRERVAANVARNGFTNVSIEPYALSDRPGELPLYRAAARFADGSFNDGLATLHPRSTVDALEEIVRVTTLDAYVADSSISRLDVMKIDVEGAEYAVIRGAAATIDRFRPFIILEVVDETSEAAGHTAQELLDRVRSHRYVVRNIDRNGRLAESGTRTTHDVLCVPEEKVDLIERDQSPAKRRSTRAAT